MHEIHIVSYQWDLKGQLVRAPPQFDAVRTTHAEKCTAPDVKQLSSKLATIRAYSVDHQRKDSKYEPLTTSSLTNSDCSNAEGYV
jgi:hypothetical protein